jgi:hypothetical protein
LRECGIERFRVGHVSSDAQGACWTLTRSNGHGNTVPESNKLFRDGSTDSSVAASYQYGSWSSHHYLSSREYIDVFQA